MKAHGGAQRQAVRSSLRVLISTTGMSRRMDSMEVNKGIAAILIAGILFFLTGTLGDILVHEKRLEKPVLAIAAAPTTSGPAAAPAPLPPIAPLLASADASVGEATAKKVCVACHTFT